MPFLVSLLMGLLVGGAYGLTGVKSPAPPLIALLGLLGMVLGEQVIVAARTHFAAPSPQQTGSVQPSGSASQSGSGQEDKASRADPS